MSRTCTCDNAGVCPSCKRLAFAMDEMRECREHNARADAEERATTFRTTTTAPSFWALERALAIVGLPTYALERTALALDAARLEGAERMREAAADLVGEMDWSRRTRVRERVLNACARIKTIDTSRVLAGEEE